MKQSANKNLIGFCAASFFGDWCHEMGTAILPMFIAQLSGPVYAPLAVGLIQGISDAVSTVAKLLSGWLSDRVSWYKPFLIIGYGLLAVFFPLIGTAHSIAAILIYKIIAWTGRGLRGPMRDTWLAKIVPPALYGRGFGLQRAWDTVGAILGPMSTFFLLRMSVSLPSIFFISAIPGICAVLSIVFLTKEEQHTHPIVKKNNFVEAIQSLPSSFTSFVAIMFLFGCGNFTPILLIYRVQELLGHEHSAIIATTHGILLYAFFNVVRAMSEYGVGVLSDYVNRKKLLVYLGFGSFAITSIGFMVSYHSLVLWIFLFGCAGLSAGAVKVLEKTYAASMLPESVRGIGLGVIQSVDGVADLLSSFIVGCLWSFVSPCAGLAYAAGLSCIAMVCLVMKR